MSEERKEGRKFDQGKPRVELLDPEWLEEVGRVMAHGATKYAAHNWRGGLHISRLLGALLRHAFSIMRGEDIDEESGLSHIGHLSCCAMFLYWTLKHRKDLDDRYKRPDEAVNKPDGNGGTVRHSLGEAVKRSTTDLGGTPDHRGFKSSPSGVVHEHGQPEVKFWPEAADLVRIPTEQWYVDELERIRAKQQEWVYAPQYDNHFGETKE